MISVIEIKVENSSFESIMDSLCISKKVLTNDVNFKLEEYHNGMFSNGESFYDRYSTYVEFLNNYYGYGYTPFEIIEYKFKDNKKYGILDIIKDDDNDEYLVRLLVI